MTKPVSTGDAALLLGPPYDQLTPVDPAGPTQALVGGWVVAWNLGSRDWASAADFVVNRAAGVSLAVILPENHDHLPVIRLLRTIEQSRPQAVLPFHETPRPREIASVIRRPPVNLASSVAEYLDWRGFSVDPVTRSIIRRTVELSARVRTISALARNLYLSRRALGRRFLKNRIPVPSHWLQISRILRATIKLQNSDGTLFNVACSLGYPDGFSLSNQMQRLCGLRPLEVRDLAGWEWVLETWIQREAERGGIAPAVLSARSSIAVKARSSEEREDRAGPAQAATV
ncbi:MAG: helix-turn-helix domain-containing protein [Gemmatimonadetes bacterium]|nr:helix-turn-helix domain-containing protein [Gemmatimonadota bacterium]